MSTVTPAREIEVYCEDVAERLTEALASLASGCVDAAASRASRASVVCLSDDLPPVYAAVGALVLASGSEYVTSDDVSELRTCLDVARDSVAALAAGTATAASAAECVLDAIRVAHAIARSARMAEREG